MAGRISQDGRRRIMSAIRDRDTRPELVVRKLLHRLGYRYRLHRRDLPGKPDIVFLGRRKIIFVHGCFWHQHQSPTCRNSMQPQSNIDYWLPKLKRNVERDAQHICKLHAKGWSVLVIWECQVSDSVSLRLKLTKFLGPARVINTNNRRC